KTHEFKRQQQLLKEKEQFSFFVPLEQLQDHNFFEAIKFAEEVDFKRWKSASTYNATFFLDAVDELKLRQGTLRKALRKISEAIGSALDRARFYISCRPNDWNKELDHDALSALIIEKDYIESAAEIPDGEEALVIAISRPNETKKTHKDDEQPTKPIQILTLLPFTRNETLEFANLYAPNQAKAFESYLEKNELWHLYCLPNEIILALEQLSAEGKLGDLEEQLKFGIKQKIQELSSKKRNTLSEEKALDGAERLALALFMMKRRSIHSKTSTSKMDVINIGDILTDWNGDEHLELLGKNLFDPTGINSFQFHHRSTQEYLAAQRMIKLRERGLGTKELFRQLFANVKSEKVVIPSMEPIAAWMALQYTDIYSEINVRNPVLMFRQGLPPLLKLEYREEIIRKYIEKFANNNTWSGVGVGLSELKRVSTPELSPVVRELWQQAYTGYDTRDLLLMLIYLAPMRDCIDLVLEALFDKKLPYEHRNYAAWSVFKFGSKEQKQKIGKIVVQGSWPERFVRELLPHLLPTAITETEFLALALNLKEIPNNVHGLGYAVLNGLKSDELTNTQRIKLRNNLAQAIWDNREEGCRIYQTQSKYDHLANAVIYSCFTTVPSDPKEAEQWARCLAIAFHFGENLSSIIARTETEKLRTLLSTKTVLREAYYWACLYIAEELE
ncbi:hypothetical protein, partial [Piscirickettsia salmonis]